MEKSEGLVVVLLLVAIALSIASVVMINNNVASSSVTGKASGVVTANNNAIVSFTLSPALVNFGNVNQSSSYATDKAGSTGPLPFGIENTGTVDLSLTVNATNNLLNSTNSHFKFNSDCVATGTCGFTAVGDTTFTYSEQSAITRLYFADDTTDNAVVGIALDVGADEPAGSKTSTIVFTAAAA